MEKEIILRATNCVITVFPEERKNDEKRYNLKITFDNRVKVVIYLLDLDKIDMLKKIAYGKVFIQISKEVEHQGKVLFPAIISLANVRGMNCQISKFNLRKITDWIIKKV
ncbi:hypothetical protein C0583_04115 [Candidatus Parcubacteria bacterium]|nr:MAG: hypothetical protein C0583_04115 [Candidatus Parcubacteria bacterium]